MCRADQLANPYIMETLVINRLKITRLKLHFHPGRGSGKPLSANKVANSSTYTSWTKETFWNIFSCFVPVWACFCSVFV